MLSGMGSFSKMIRVFLFCLFEVMTTRANAMPFSASKSEQIVAKLEKSRTEANFSLEAARETCLEALNLCKILNNDILHTDALLQLGNIVSLRGDNQEALTHFEQALKKAEAAHYLKGQCNALLEAGYIHYVWGEYDHAFSMFKKALGIATQNHFKEQEAKALNLVGKYYHTKGHYDLSIAYYRQAAAVTEQLDDYDRMVTLFLNIGKTYIGEENIYMTLSYYLKAFDASEKSGNKLLKADVYNHLGSIYLFLKQPDKSLEYHHQALKLRKEMNSYQAVATSCNNLGETFLYLSNYDSAAVYLHESYELCLRTGYKKGTVKALTNLGRVNNRTGDLSRAHDFLIRAYSLSMKAGYEAGVVESALALGQNYLLKKEYPRAIGYFEQSLSRMIPANMNEFLTDAYEGLFTCYNELGDYRKALDYHVKLNQAERNELLAQSDRQLAELRVSFDLERKESDNQKLRQENELKQLALTKRAWIIWSVVITLISTIVLCLLIYGRYRQKRSAHIKLQKLNTALELANTEKDKMFSIIAHELRNPLYWFRNLTEVLSKNHTQMSAEKLGKSLLAIDESAKNAFHLMDNLLNWSRTRLNRVIPRKADHDLTGLINETLRMFETIVNQKEIELKTSLPAEAVIYVDADMFTCILRNLVSNAIKYTPVKGQILIEASCRDQFCTLHVTDSGIGVSPHGIAKLFTSGSFNPSPGLMQEKGSGLGLKLCKEFVQLNDGEIWAACEKDQGTCFSFSIPLGRQVASLSVGARDVSTFP